MEGGELLGVLKEGLEEVEVTTDGWEDEADVFGVLFQEEGLDGGRV